MMQLNIKKVLHFLEQQDPTEAEESRNLLNSKHRIIQRTVPTKHKQKGIGRQKSKTPLCESPAKHLHMKPEITIDTLHSFCSCKQCLLSLVTHRKMDYEEKMDTENC